MYTDYNYVARMGSHILWSVDAGGYRYHITLGIYPYRLIKDLSMPFEEAVEELRQLQFPYRAAEPIAA